MNEHLDAIDRQLLSLRQPTPAILARQLGLARTTVAADYGVRLGRLQEEAAVRTYCFISVQPKTPAAVIRPFPEHGGRPVRAA